MFLLVPAYPGCPGSKAVKRSSSSSVNSAMAVSRDDSSINILLVIPIIIVIVVGLEFFETSAKDNVNVKAVFERLVDIICDKMSESLDAEPTSAVANSSQTRQLTASVNNDKASSCSC